jgi:hypothetical protein
MKPIPVFLLILVAGCSRTAPVGATAPIGASEGAICSRTTDVGSCGQAPQYKDDGTPCTTAWGASTNTCNQLSPGANVTITSCATVTTFHPEFAGRPNTNSSQNCGQPGYLPCTVDTGWFTTLAECCLGSRAFGAGVPWGETKICCQVADGQSPAKCETPCGTGGQKGCATCTIPVSGGVGGSCTIATAPVDDNDCQGDVGQFSQTITIQGSSGGCVADASHDDSDVQ